MAGFTIQNSVGATVFSILSGLSILSFVAWSFTTGGCSSSGGAPISPLPESSATATSLREDLAEATASLDAESARRAELALELEESKTALSSLESELEALRAKHAEADAQISGWKASFGGDVASVESAAETQEKLKALRAKNKTLTAQLAESAKADLKALEEENGELRKTLAAERKSCREAKATLNAEIDTLRKELDKELYGEQLKPAGDFPALDLPYLVNDPIQLNRKVRPVFIKLRGMKEEESELKKVYEALTKDGKTSALHKVPFEVGSSEVKEAEDKKLNELLQDSPEGARYLVVGYASTDGDAKSNYELSSKRASSVATKLASIKGIPEDAVQAVYFGQTQRFSATEMAPNRIVEVWRVK